MIQKKNSTQDQSCWIHSFVITYVTPGPLLLGFRSFKATLQSVVGKWSTPLEWKVFWDCTPFGLLTVAQPCGRWLSSHGVISCKWSPVTPVSCMCLLPYPMTREDLVHGWCPLSLPIVFLTLHLVFKLTAECMLNLKVLYKKEAILLCIYMGDIHLCKNCILFWSNDMDTNYHIQVSENVDLFNWVYC